MKQKTHKAQLITMVSETTREYILRKAREHDVSVSHLIRRILREYKAKNEK